MKTNKLTFQSENLVVDWISFKFQDLDNRTMMEIANYLFKLGFNSYQESGKLAKPMKESIVVSSKNKSEVLFVIDNSYWKGTIVQFSGNNAASFYNLVKNKLINCELFSSATLGRFDIYYSRKNKINDKISVTNFFENCHRKLKQTNKNVIFEKNKKGLILKIGNRKSNQYFRIYQGKNSLKFEHEMKGKFLRKYRNLLLENRLEEFEQKLYSHFIISFGKLLTLNYSYLDWLIIKLRPIRKQTISQHGLNSDYIKSEIVMDTKKFVSLIQFLNYAQELDFEIEYLGPVAYRKLTFQLRNFLEFQDPTVKPTNQYRLDKIKEFFQQLQSGLFVTSFSDASFQSLVAVPQVQFEKSSGNNFMLGKVWLIEELFHYKYPFYLPNLFQQKLSKHELLVRVKFLQIFSSVNIEKEVFIKELFKSYPSALNNQQKTKIKKSFIGLVKLLEQHDLIEPKYKILSDGNLHDTQELTSRNISEGFVIYEKLTI
jgi:hypothetical protein